MSYADQRRCAHNLNLIALFGDQTPDNGSIKCNSKFCGTQIVGTGRSMSDVLIDNKFTKLNAIRADRLGGLYLRNFTVQQSEFNSVYVMETDGFVLDKLTARANDEYGILAFASDHGVIKNSDTYYNGDSGIYPGSASDLNADNTSLQAGPLRDRDPQQPQPRQHARLLRHRGQLGLGPRQRLLPQRHRHRDGLVVPRPPGTPAGPRAVEQQPDPLQQPATGTRSSSTRACAPSR